MIKKIYIVCACIDEVLGTFFMVKGYLDKNIFYLGLMTFCMAWAILNTFFIIESNKSK